MIARASHLFLPTLRAAPADAEAVNHKLLVRGGFVRQVTGGVWTFLPLGWRVPSSDALLDTVMRGGVRSRALLRAQTPEALLAIREQLRRLTQPFERGGALELPAPCVLAAAEKA